MKYLILFATVVGLSSCGGSENTNSTSGTSDQVGTPQSESTPTGGAPDNPSSKGAQLIASSDCLSCHKEHEKVVGPAYAEVAKKYPNSEENVKLLADKIIAGGAGNWGDVPMTPHPQISKEDAAEMAKYILSIQ